MAIKAKHRKNLLKLAAYLEALPENYAQAIAALPELIEALRQSLTGWQNVLELGLIPERHRDTAQKLADDARAALTKAGGPQ